MKRRPLISQSSSKNLPPPPCQGMPQDPPKNLMAACNLTNGGHSKSLLSPWPSFISNSPFPSSSHILNYLFYSISFQVPPKCCYNLLWSFPSGFWSLSNEDHPWIFTVFFYLSHSGSICGDGQVSLYIIVTYGFIHQFFQAAWKFYLLGHCH